MSGTGNGGTYPSELELAALATAAVPGLSVLGTRGYVTWANGVCVTVVDGDGNDWQVSAGQRVPQEQLSRTLAVLQLLAGYSKAGKLPFAVPEPKGIVDRKPNVTVFVYQHIGGEPGADGMVRNGTLLATSLGSALGALHELPASRYAEATNSRASAAERRREYSEMVERAKMAIPSDLRVRWVEALKDDTLWLYQEVPIHGDLGARYLQVAPGGAVLGIRGFEQARVDDPAYDALWLLYQADDQFLEQFESAYSRSRKDPDLHLMTRAQLIAELETLRWYDQGARSGDENWRSAGAQALRDLAEELGGDMLVPAQPDVVEIRFTAEEEPLLRVNPHLRKSVSTGATSAADPLPGPADEANPDT